MSFRATRRHSAPRDVIPRHTTSFRATRRHLAPRVILLYATSYRRLPSGPGAERLPDGIWPHATSVSTRDILSPWGAQLPSGC